MSASPTRPFSALGPKAQVEFLARELADWRAGAWKSLHGLELWRRRLRVAAAANKGSVAETLATIERLAEVAATAP